MKSSGKMVTGLANYYHPLSLVVGYRYCYLKRRGSSHKHIANFQFHSSTKCHSFKTRYLFYAITFTDTSER